MPFYSNLIPIFNDKKKDSCSLCQWYLMTSNQLVIITNWLFIYKMMMNVPDIQKWKKVNSINFQREKGAHIQVMIPEFCSFYHNLQSSLHLCLHLLSCVVFLRTEMMVFFLNFRLLFIFVFSMSVSPLLPYK